MEQVRRYDFIDYFVMNPRQNRVLGENAEGRYVLASDHARCVQDVRKLARMVQVLCRRDEDKPDWEIAQAVLDRWPGVQE